MSQHPTALEIRQMARDEAGEYTLHRHDAQEHSPTSDCWCTPITLTSEQILAYSLRDLQSLLDQHYRVH